MRKALFQSIRSTPYWWVALLGLLSLPMMALGQSSEFSPDPDSDAADPLLGASWETRTEARTLTLSVPAPRGQIVDRNGLPLVQNRVAYYLAFEYPTWEDPSDQQIVAYAQGKIAAGKRLLGRGEWLLDEERALSHYEHRRWLPYIFSDRLSDGELRAVEQSAEPGLVPHPYYLRHYPHGKMAAHILGYVGEVRKLPTGAIEDKDPVFKPTFGRYGLEQVYDEALTGKPGIINILFGADGTRLNEEMVERPQPGDNVVTSLDLHYQQFAEQSLANRARSGAMVVIDCRTGDILAMASRPAFDPSAFAEGIGTEAYRKLNEDPDLPLYPRTFQGLYPPASTFKVAVALAAMERGVIDSSSYYECAPSMSIGDRVFRNWNKSHEGHLNVVSAIKRSCNTWFYKVGIMTGTDSVSSMAERLGYGQPTGIPLPGEKSGHVPSNVHQQKTKGQPIYEGDLANISIGQGAVTATPLQVARSMASIGMGEYLSKLRLVRQVQDLHDDVVEVFPPAARIPLNVSSESLRAVRQGMVAVVSSSDGTGKSASISQAQVAGKTGTAQWKAAEGRELAWFAGFVPAGNPRYAFAAVYEGRPGEKVSGGRKAAPIVHDVLHKIYAHMAEEGAGSYEEFNGEVEKILPEEMARPDLNGPAAPKAVPLPEEQPAEPKKPGFLKRLFGGGR